MRLQSLFDPRKYINKYKSFFSADQKEIEIYNKDVAGGSIDQKQNAVFSSLALNRDEALLALRKQMEVTALLRPYIENLDTATLSEHWIFFTALRNSQIPIKRILEIGTFMGDATHLLSHLFPEAEIITLDLPDDSPVFLSSDGRDDPEFLKKFLATREQMLARQNIRFIRENSFNIPALGLGLFDLVWVDAGHNHPEVSWDVCNAWHLCQPGGWMLYDDIYLSATPSEAWGGTPDSRDALLAIERYKLATVHFILKRLAPVYSADPHVRKHIGVVRKPV